MTIKDISWQVSEEEYRADPAFSYSTLAKFYRTGFEGLPTLFDKVESPSLTFGSVVDCLMTDSPDEFERRFFVADFENPGDSYERVVKWLLNDTNYQPFDLLTYQQVFNAVQMCEFQRNWRDDTRVRVIREKCSSMYNAYVRAKGKQLISTQVYTDAKACVMALYSSDVTRWYFNEDPFDDSIQRFFQLKFRGEYNGIPLRCMADLIITDDKNKLVIPCDLKTSHNPEYKFPHSFLDWNYFIQYQLYSYIIRQNMDKDPQFKDYTLTPYRFIVVCNKTRNPLVWDIDDSRSVEELNKEYGLTLPNWRELAEELNYCLNGKPIVPKDINLNSSNGIFNYIKTEKRKGKI